VYAIDYQKLKLLQDKSKSKIATAEKECENL